jgi:hypothetical protein
MKLIKEIKSLVYKAKKNYRNVVLKQKINNFYNSNNSKIKDLELLSSLKYYSNNELSVFPYLFKNEYSKLEFTVTNENGFNYILFNGYKMYFKQNWSVLSCKSYIKTLLVEQDARSPHCYCTDNFHVNNDETLLDIGAAEGNFSLLSINKAKEIYLFEYNNDWFKALEKTFEPFTEKVKLINKKVDNKTASHSIKLDDLPELYTKKLFIKMDVEGSERAIFKGMEKLLATNKNIRIAVCTYHGYNDAVEFENYFKHLGFKTEFSSGYMLYYFAKDLKPPYLRKGVLRVWR